MSTIPWWEDPRRQFSRKADLTTETTVNLDFNWTDADLIDSNELCLTSVEHRSNQSVAFQAYHVRIEQPVGTEVPGGFSTHGSGTVALRDGRGKSYTPPGIYLKKANGAVRVAITLGAAMNPGFAYAVAQKNRVS